MMKFAEDIVEQGGVFDPPLVKKTKDKFVVYDGNRRVTCLKILAGLLEAPQSYVKVFEVFRATAPWPSDIEITCQIEEIQTRIDEIISRRHNGTDGGRGQLRWDPRAKANHANRIGANNQYPIAEAIENFLEEKGYPHTKDLKRSTLYRLLNAKKRQEELGVSLSDDGSLQLHRSENEVLSAFSKIADDILDKKLTLKNVLNSEGVEEYMDRLRSSGLT